MRYTRTPPLPIAPEPIAPQRTAGACHRESPLPSDCVLATPDSAPSASVTLTTPSARRPWSGRAGRPVGSGHERPHRSLAPRAARRVANATGLASVVATAFATLDFGGPGWRHAGR